MTLRKERGVGVVFEGVQDSSKVYLVLLYLCNPRVHSFSKMILHRFCVLVLHPTKAVLATCLGLAEWISATVHICVVFLS